MGSSKKVTFKNNNCDYCNNNSFGNHMLGNRQTRNACIDPFREQIFTKFEYLVNPLFQKHSKEESKPRKRLEK